MVRSKHPKKEIEDALQYAELHFWRVVQGGSHGWGKIYCPYNDMSCRCGEFCVTSVWSTPRNPGNHARALRRVVDRCQWQTQGPHRICQLVAQFRDQVSGAAIRCGMPAQQDAATIGRIHLQHSSAEFIRRIHQQQASR